MTDAYDDATAAFERRRLEFGADANETIERFRAAMRQLKEPPAAALYTARSDLVKRMVAVAISVGFASVLGTMAWLRDGLPPTPLETEQLVRLFVGLWVILLGWDWYHRDIDRYPETTFLRFLVDVSVVVASLIFLISSTHERLWLFFLALVFVFYVVWDGVTYCPIYYPRALGLWRRHQTLRARWTAIRNAQIWREIPGPVTNVFWMGYFIGIWLIDACFQFSSLRRAMIPCAFVAAGAVLLRLDGRSGWILMLRGCAILGLWLLFFVCLALARWLATPAALQVTRADISPSGVMVIAGRAGRPNANVKIGDEPVGSDASGDFRFETTDVPLTCKAAISDEVSTTTAYIKGCGPRGQVGPRGPKGSAGERGEAGSRGLTGLDGARGEPGQKGDKGLDGAKGDVGPAGPVGSAGPRGKAGVRGPRGKAGSSSTAGRFPFIPLPP